MSATHAGAELEFRALRRSFPGTGTVIDGISARLAPGEFVALLGPSGCGKSTFLRLAAGLDKADGGEVRLHGADGALSRGFVFQDAHLLPWRNVVANVALPLTLAGQGKDEASQKAVAALKQVGLADALAKYPNELSGGMRMRVSVARALVTKPSLLLLDEPFAALDENSRHRLQEDLRALWRSQPMTILFVTHSVSEAVFVADRALVLSGRPARLVLDRKIELPDQRTPDLRMELPFVREMKAIQAAFAAGEES